MMKGRSRKMCGHGVFINKKAMFANCILFATFCPMGALVRRKKTWRYSARKVMDFGKLMVDILVYVSCKFEMNIFEIAQVIGENIPIAFLYVLYVLSILSIRYDKASHTFFIPSMVCRSFLIVTIKIKRTFIFEDLFEGMLNQIKEFFFFLDYGPTSFL